MPCSCDCPCASGAAADTEDGEAGQVGRCGEQVEVRVKFGSSSDSCSSAAVAASHQLSQSAFHLWASASVVVTPIGVAGSGAGSGQESYVAAECDGPAPSRGGAVGAQRAVGASRFELGDAIAGFVASDGDFLAGGAGDCLGAQVDVKVVLAVTPARRDRRLGLAARVDAGPSQDIQEVSAAIGGVAVHLRAGRALGRLPGLTTALTTRWLALSSSALAVSQASSAPVRSSIRSAATEALPTLAALTSVSVMISESGSRAIDPL